MAAKLTQAEATDAAREFVRLIVKPGRPWNTHHTLAGFLPKGWVLREGADYAGPVTIATLAAFLRAEAIEDGR